MIASGVAGSAGLEGHPDAVGQAPAGQALAALGGGRRGLGRDGVQVLVIHRRGQAEGAVDRGAPEVHHLGRPLDRVLRRPADPLAHARVLERAYDSVFNECYKPAVELLRAAQEEIDAAWDEEIKHRIEDLNSGAAKFIP